MGLLTKNDAKYLPDFFNTLASLDYPRDLLRLVWIYGKSVDNTLNMVLDEMDSKKYNYEVYQEPVIERPIASSLYNAELCNQFKKVYDKEPYFLLLDTDVTTIPSHAIKELIKVDKDVVAPYPLMREPEGRERFYDTYCFRWHGWKYEYVVENGKTFDPWNIFHIGDAAPLEMDSVGTMTMIKGKVLEAVNFTNPAPIMQFCWSSRKAGFHVWALPYLRIYHTNVDDTDIPHHNLEYYCRTGILPKEELFKVGYKKLQNGDFLLDTY
jgi:hypothetical protein